MAYIVIGALAVGALMALGYIFVMATISFIQCHPSATIGKGDAGTIAIVSCTFDPLPIGQAAGLIFGAFGALIGALAGYMAATRRSSSTKPAAEVSVASHMDTVTTVTPKAAKTGAQKGRR